MAFDEHIRIPFEQQSNLCSTRTFYCGRMMMMVQGVRRRMSEGWMNQCDFFSQLGMRDSTCTRHSFISLSSSQVGLACVTPDCGRRQKQIL